MPAIEKISIALPQEMVSAVHHAVETGEYSSSSEVVREALREWTQKRKFRQQATSDLRRIWKQAVADKTPDVSADEVLDRLEAKYRVRASVSVRPK